MLAHAPRQPESWLTWDVGQKMKLNGKRMSEGERWDYDLRNQPWTFVFLIANVIAMPLGMIYVAIGIEDPKKQPIAWVIWAVVALFLFLVLLAVWNAEKKGLLSDKAKRSAWRLLYVGGLAIAVVCVGGIVWPGVPLGLRVKAGAVLCGILTGLGFLRPIMKTANQALQHNDHVCHGSCSEQHAPRQP